MDMRHQVFILRWLIIIMLLQSEFTDYRLKGWPLDKLRVDLLQNRKYLTKFQKVTEMKAVLTIGTAEITTVTLLIPTLSRVRWRCLRMVKATNQVVRRLSVDLGLPPHRWRRNKHMAGVNFTLAPGSVLAQAEKTSKKTFLTYLERKPGSYSLYGQRIPCNLCHIHER